MLFKAIMDKVLTIPPLTEDLENIIIDAETIDRRVAQLAEKIDRDYKDKKEPLMLIGVLKGSFIFLSDLSRKLTLPHTIDFISISSYGEKGDEQGEVRMVMDTRENSFGKNVLIVEDILDSGHTLNYLTKLFKSRGAASVEPIVFLDKKERHKVKVDIKYIGFEIPDIWVVGYGLDYKEKYRTLPYIAEMKRNR